VERLAPLVGRTILAASTEAAHDQRAEAGEYDRLWRGGDANSSSLGWKGRGANGQRTGALREMSLLGYHRGDEAAEMLPVVLDGRLHSAYTDCHH
jgi:hypothetical protein